MSAPLRIGLTGGIGSGKSTVCELFSGYRIPVIDADKIARDLLQQGEPGYQAAIDLFGEKIVLDNGDLDRALMRSMVFSDNPLRKSLENLLHPLIFDEIGKQVSQLHSDYCIISIPLLFEMDCRHLVDRVLVVDAPEDLRLERASHRDNSSPEQIMKIMSAQASQAERLSIADDIINNDRDIKNLGEQVRKLHNMYKKMASELR